MNFVCDIDKNTLLCSRCGLVASSSAIYRMCTVPRWPGLYADSGVGPPHIVAKDDFAHFPAAPPSPPTSGPGTELKKLLKTWLRIEATPTCSCNARARRMDEEEAREPGWCAFHIEEIVGWLREEAEKRGLPFLDAAGRVIVRRAISNARKEQARAEKAAAAEGSEAT